MLYFMEDSADANSFAIGHTESKKIYTSTRL